MSGRGTQTGTPDEATTEPRATAFEIPISGSADEPDFYFENGLAVFTAKYLRSRGYCCESSCRHCPYGFRASSKTA